MSLTVAEGRTGCFLRTLPIQNLLQFCDSLWGMLFKYHREGNKGINKAEWERWNNSSGGWEWEQSAFSWIRQKDAACCERVWLPSSGWKQNNLPRQETFFRGRIVAFVQSDFGKSQDHCRCWELISATSQLSLQSHPGQGACCRMWLWEICHQGLVAPEPPHTALLGGAALNFASRLRIMWQI